MAKAPALGKGLGALISSNANRITAPAPVVEQGERIINVPHAQVVPCPFQPRQTFKPEDLAELVESIREKGVIQPLIVRKLGDKYELIAGERRWRAARELQLREVPVIVRQASNQEVLELALIENIQRASLNPIEEALAYERLHKEHNSTQEDIAKQVGKSRVVVANALRLLALHPDVQGYVKTGTISVGHAKVLLSLKTHDEQKHFAEEIIRQGATVRITETLVSRALEKSGASSGGGTSKKKSSAEKAHLEPALKRVENQLTHRLTTRVTLQHTPKRGTITIEYYGDDDLNRVLKVLGIENGD